MLGVYGVFLVVTWSTWIVNGIFLSFRGYPTAAAVCFADSVVHLIILVSLWNHASYSRIMNLNLMASGIGLVCRLDQCPADGDHDVVLSRIYRSRLTDCRCAGPPSTGW